MTRNFLINSCLAICISVLFSCNNESGSKNSANKNSVSYRSVANGILNGDSEVDVKEIVRIGQFFSERANYETSIPLFRKALEKDPQNLTGKLLLANNLRQTGEYNEPLQIYNELVQIDSIEFIVLPERARLYTHLTEFEKATIDIEKARGIEPKYFAIFLADGLLQYAQGRQQEALDLFDIAIELDPGVSSEAHLYAGYILLNNKLNYDALGKFTKAIEIGKNINIGYAFINRGVSQINLQDTAFACVDWDSGAYYMPQEAKKYIDQYCPK